MDFFSSLTRKLFLVGLLTQKLLNVQMAKEKRAPFVNRLKGLKLGQKDIKGFCPKSE